MSYANVERRVVCIGLLTLVVILVSHSGYTQGAYKRPPIDPAREAYIEAILAIGEFDYRTAEAKLEEATRLDPTNPEYAQMLVMLRRQQPKPQLHEKQP